MTQRSPDTGGDGQRDDEEWEDEEWEGVTDESEDEAFDEHAALFGDKWGEEWSKAVVATVAAEVCRRRTELGLSQHELAARCGDVGYPVPRNVLANLESGRRHSLQIVELLVLAKALDCVPVALLFPVGRRETVHPLPGGPRPALTAANWFSGLGRGEEDNWLFIYRDHAKQQRALAEIDYDLPELQASLRNCVHFSERRKLQDNIARLQKRRDKITALLASDRAELQAEGLLPLDPDVYDT